MFDEPHETNLDSPLYRRTGLRLLLGLAAAVGALIVFALLSNWVLEGETKHFDGVVLDTIHRYATPQLTSLMRLLTHLGSTTFLLIVSILLVFQGLKRRRAAVLLAITMAGAALLIWVLKAEFQRPRPVPFFEFSHPKTYSFPSGHALGAFCFYGALAAIIADRMPKRRWRTITWTVAVLVIGVIGFSRIYLGVHYPSDVLAGYAAGLVWVITVASVDRLLLRRRAGPTPHSQKEKA